VISVWTIQNKNVSSTPRARDGQQRLLLTRSRGRDCER